MALRSPQPHPQPHPQLHQSEIGKLWVWLPAEQHSLSTVGETVLNLINN